MNGRSVSNAPTARPEPRANIASALSARAAANPRQAAVMLPGGRGPAVRAAWTYQELEERSAALAAGFQSIGVEQGARCVLMIPPSLELFGVIFALFRAGIVPVVVDPGIGLGSLKRCLAEAQPRAFAGVPGANAARALLGWARETIRTVVTTGRFRIGRGFTLREVEARGARERVRDAVAPGPHEPAAILFTSGSTGPPKGVVYTHANFGAQVEALRTTYEIEPGEVDLCTFPLFALFAPALGMTAVVPDMDPTRPARADPRRLLETARDFGATNFFGSPALIRSVGRHGAGTGFKLPLLRRAISAGAPVPAKAIEQFLEVLPAGAQVFTPYGATEALPVTSIGSRELLGETRALTEQGRGVCIGRPAGEARVELIRVSDEPIARWSDDLRVTEGEVGEIAVSGPVVTREYFGKPDAERLAKIEAENGFLHRMGDLGRRDERGRIWFCGRKSQRVETRDGVLYTIPCEAVFNAHPRVFRTALVGVPRGEAAEPALCVELERPLGRKARTRLARELAETAQNHPHTRSIHAILFRRKFPVDIRHNAKIGREKLARWAARRLS